jgi:hypothetical protein
MEIQEIPKLRGAALFRKMLDNKKLIQSQAVEEYKNSKEMQEIMRELRESNARKKMDKISI